MMVHALKNGMTSLDFLGPINPFFATVGGGWECKRGPFGAILAANQSSDIQLIKQPLINRRAATGFSLPAQLPTANLFNCLLPTTNKLIRRNPLTSFSATS